MCGGFFKTHMHRQIGSCRGDASFRLGYAEPPLSKREAFGAHHIGSLLEGAVERSETEGVVTPPRQIPVYRLDNI